MWTGLLHHLDLDLDLDLDQSGSGSGSGSGGAGTQVCRHIQSMIIVSA
jgi:hypothetical protein